MSPGRQLDVSLDLYEPNSIPKELQSVVSIDELEEPEIGLPSQYLLNMISKARSIVRYAFETAKQLASTDTKQYNEAMADSVPLLHLLADKGRISSIAQDIANLRSLLNSPEVRDLEHDGAAAFQSLLVARAENLRRKQVMNINTELSISAKHCMNAMRFYSDALSTGRLAEKGARRSNADYCFEQLVEGVVSVFRRVDQVKDLFEISSGTDDTRPRDEATDYLSMTVRDGKAVLSAIYHNYAGCVAESNAWLERQCESIKELASCQPEATCEEIHRWESWVIAMAGARQRIHMLQKRIDYWQSLCERFGRCLKESDTEQETNLRSQLKALEIELANSKANQEADEAERDAKLRAPEAIEAEIQKKKDEIERQQAITAKHQEQLEQVTFSDYSTARLPELLNKMRETVKAADVFAALDSYAQKRLSQLYAIRGLADQFRRQLIRLRLAESALSPHSAKDACTLLRALYSAVTVDFCAKSKESIRSRLTDISARLKEMENIPHPDGRGVLQSLTVSTVTLAIEQAVKRCSPDQPDAKGLSYAMKRFNLLAPAALEKLELSLLADYGQAHVRNDDVLLWAQARLLLNGTAIEYLPDSLQSDQWLSSAAFVRLLQGDGRMSAEQAASLLAPTLSSSNVTSKQRKQAAREVLAVLTTEESGLSPEETKAARSGFAALTKTDAKPAAAAVSQALTACFLATARARARSTALRVSERVSATTQQFSRASAKTQTAARNDQRDVDLVLAQAVAIQTPSKLVTDSVFVQTPPPAEVIDTLRAVGEPALADQLQLFRDYAINAEEESENELSLSFMDASDPDEATILAEPHEDREETQMATTMDQESGVCVSHIFAEEEARSETGVRALYTHTRPFSKPVPGSVNNELTALAIPCLLGTQAVPAEEELHRLRVALSQAYAGSDGSGNVAKLLTSIMPERLSAWGRHLIKCLLLGPAERACIDGLHPFAIRNIPALLSALSEVPDDDTEGVASTPDTVARVLAYTRLAAFDRIVQLHRVEQQTQILMMIGRTIQRSVQLAKEQLGAAQSAFSVGLYDEASFLCSLQASREASVEVVARPLFHVFRHVDAADSLSSARAAITARFKAVSDGFNDLEQQIAARRAQLGDTGASSGSTEDLQRLRGETVLRVIYGIEAAMRRALLFDRFRDAERLRIISQLFVDPPAQFATPQLEQLFKKTHAAFIFNQELSMSHIYELEDDTADQTEPPAPSPGLTESLRTCGKEWAQMALVDTKVFDQYSMRGPNDSQYEAAERLETPDRAITDHVSLWSNFSLRLGRGLFCLISSQDPSEVGLALNATIGTVIPSISEFLNQQLSYLDGLEDVGSTAQTQPFVASGRRIVTSEAHRIFAVTQARTTDAPAKGQDHPVSEATAAEEAKAALTAFQASPGYAAFCGEAEDTAIGQITHSIQDMTFQGVGTLHSYLDALTGRAALGSRNLLVNIDSKLM